jgi:hypothetical protein
MKLPIRTAASTVTGKGRDEHIKRRNTQRTVNLKRFRTAIHEKSGIREYKIECPQHEGFV